MSAKKAIDVTGRNSCDYCKRPFDYKNKSLFPTLDHKTPKTRGGPIQFEKGLEKTLIAISCRQCNMLKNDFSNPPLKRVRL